MLRFCKSIQLKPIFHLLTRVYFTTTNSLIIMSRLENIIKLIKDAPGGILLYYILALIFELLLDQRTTGISSNEKIPPTNDKAG